MPLPPCKEPTDPTLSNSTFVLGHGCGQGPTEKSGFRFLPLQCNEMTSFINRSSFQGKAWVQTLAGNLLLCSGAFSGFLFSIRSFCFYNFVLPCPSSYFGTPLKLKLGFPALPPSRMDLQPFEGTSWAWRDGHQAAPGTAGTWEGLTPHWLV